MYIIPAIDLESGKCVRLIQGEYHRRIIYEDDPVKQACRFIAAGAKWLHIVDLDGARIGKPVNTAVISAIAAAAKIKIEVGGGIRDEDDVKQLLDMGIDRVVIGTKATSDYEWFSKIVRKVASHGWTHNSSKTLLEFAVEASALPLAAIIYTDITKDGMMAGPNLERTKSIAKAVKVPVVASGGVSSIADIEKLAKLNLEGAIIGRSLYEGTLDLADAIKAAGGH
jgi:phosphoribosylformimino-5-aminoimidazole carboxamide ribotide isomerase